MTSLRVGETRVGETVISAAVHLPGGVRRWAMPAAALPLDRSPGSPWVLLPPVVRRAFDVLAEAGRPLAESAFGSPMLGVKCGCNDAFLVVLDPSDVPADTIATVRTADRRQPARRGTVERSLLRPVLRGQTIGSSTGVEGEPKGRSPATGRSTRRMEREWIVWTHHDSDAGLDRPLATLPPHALRWLAPWRHRLAARSDARGGSPWWALFRTESANTGWPRVIWSDLGRRPRAIVVPTGDGTVVLNSCYAVRGPDAADTRALAALLNSEIAAAWLNVVAEPARGGYHRYLGWTVGLLPLPRRWDRARDLLAPRRADPSAGALAASAETRAVADAYGVALDDLAPLVDWSRG